MQLLARAGNTGPSDSRFDSVAPAKSHNFWLLGPELSGEAPVLHEGQGLDLGGLSFGLQVCRFFKCQNLLAFFLSFSQSSELLQDLGPSFFRI